MRLLQKDLKNVYIFGQQAVNEDSPDFYPGQEAEDVYTHTIRCNVQPAESRITVEVYGVKVYSMYSLICEPACNIPDNARISFVGKDKPTHKIASIKEYGTHKVLLVEVIT